MTTHLPQFVIAEKTSGAPWPKSGQFAQAIAQARIDYENGKIEMATRREGAVEFLYAIPRKHRAIPRPGYFNKQ